MGRAVYPDRAVFGDEVNVEGKRYFQSLVRHAKDSQRMFNYWRTTATELVALAPKAPWIGPEIAFEVEGEAEKWASANTQSHAFLRYKGNVPPQRQPFAGVPAGALQEAMNASDDIKAAIGLFDASLGAASNETSGRAILARQREGDVGTFHFIDNLTRGIRCAGRILIDLIPQVYTGKRIVRIIGEDGQTQAVPLGQAIQLGGMQRVFDLSAGSYDIDVKAGPSFTSRREEAANQMIELVRAFPQAAPLLGDLLAKNLDWPDADKVAKRLQSTLPPQFQDNPPPQPPGPPPPPPEVLAAQAMANAEVQANREKLQAQVMMNREKLAAETQMNREKLMAESALKRDTAAARTAPAVAERLAAMGRGGDTEIAHVTPGEIVVPRAWQDAKMMRELQMRADRTGVPLDQFAVGASQNSINPNTRVPEFPFLKANIDGGRSGGGDYDGFGNGNMEEITVTGARDTGFRDFFDGGNIGREGLTEQFVPRETGGSGEYHGTTNTGVPYVKTADGKYIIQNNNPEEIVVHATKPIDPQSVKNILINEMRALNGPGLADAATAMTHSILNADEAFGPLRSKFAGTAPTSMPKNLGPTEQKVYDIISHAVDDAAIARKTNGVDPTNFATHFNLPERQYQEDRPPIPPGDQGQLFKYRFEQQFGPFYDSNKGIDKYINIWRYDQANPRRPQ
jgi:hypothetical protein